eukprot:TRINITY_DN8308_c0_g2_i1.p1 TRINITY_DN8308_c0_g2~~TRINITY_DN8308_c0_g2_i1.p1  ORF type:complete len:246 (-),score=15.56 TRINITY_DN8308_c0_g2_i1:374-1111(-)
MVMQSGGSVPLEPLLQNSAVRLICFLGLVTIVLPNLFCFGWSMRCGLAFIDWFYPWPQNHQAFLKHPRLIRSHVVLNGASLLLGFGLVFHEERVLGAFSWNQDKWLSFRALLVLYLSLLFLGTFFSLRFSSRNATHRATGTFAFGVMAAGAVLPACAATLAAFGSGESSRHIEDEQHMRARAHLTRSFAAQFGAGVCFRILAVTAMKIIPNSHKREAWLILIFVSWWLPGAVCDALWTPGLGILV